MIRLPFSSWRQMATAPVAPWELCQEPWRWAEADVWTAEAEVLLFLRALVVLHKPKVIVETGTYMGESAGMMAMGCRDNGIGHVWSFDIKAEAIEHSERFLTLEELSTYVTLAVADARTVEWDRDIDFLFIDGGEDRGAELEHFAPFLTPRALVAMHNAHDPTGFYRLPKAEQWNQILIPCPCGLYLMSRK